MIKFFRKIRLQLLTEKKISRYFLYAIGEIILVVLGILIALSVNNWNEERKTEKLEINMLDQVKKGLIFDLNQVEEIIELQNTYIRSHQILIKWLESSLPFHDTLGLHFMETFFAETCIFKEGPYETLKKIGMEIIKNDTLRDQISNLYDLSYEELRVWSEDFFAFKHHYSELMGDKRFRFLNHTDPFGGYEPLNVSNLKSDETFIFNLTKMMGGVQIYNAKIEKLRISINQLIYAIESGLKIR